MDSPRPTYHGLDYVPYFREQIEIQQGAILSFKRWMFGLFVLGIVIVAAAIGFKTYLQAISSQIIGIGGVFVSALAALPYREIAPRRARISSYDLLRRGFEAFDQIPDDDKQRLKEMAIEVVKSSIK